MAEKKAFHNLGLVNEPLDDAQIEAIPLVGLDEGIRGGLVWMQGDGRPVRGYVRMGLDDIMVHDYRGFAYDVEERIIANRHDWQLEGVTYKPVLVDDDGNIVLLVSGYIYDCRR